MIGQAQLIEQIDNWVDMEDFPRFLIITGAKGSGKATLARLIAKKLGAFLVNCELGVDAVREAVENCYRCNGVTVYTFLNADKMSAQAKNALLKITEEPPRSAHFIMTLQDPNNTLETLRSRGTMLSMQPYSVSELREYMGDDVNETILQIASTPGDVDELRKINVDEFVAFCEKVLDNIAVVSGVNAFKIPKSLKLKDDGDGYDPIMFLRGIMRICLLRAGDMAGVELYADTIKMYLDIITLTSKYIRDLQITGIKKDSTLDMWILDVRSVMQGVM